MHGETKRFSLAALMVLTTVFAAWLALTMAWPWMGTIGAVLAATALLRTHQIAVFHRTTGKRFDFEQHVRAFLCSLVLVAFLAAFGALTYAMASLMLAALIDLVAPALFLHDELPWAVILISALIFTLLVVGLVARHLLPLGQYDYTAIELWRQRERKESDGEQAGEEE